MNTLQITTEYRNAIEQSLDRARRDLSARDFAVVAPGLEAEISRLDQEIENLKFRAFMGCCEGSPPFPRVAQIVQRACVRLVPVPEEVISLEKKEIKRFSNTSQRRAVVLPKLEPTLSMGLSFAQPA